MHSVRFFAESPAFAFVDRQNQTAIFGFPSDQRHVFCLERLHLNDLRLELLHAPINLENCVPLAVQGDFLLCEQQDFLGTTNQNPTLLLFDVVKERRWLFEDHSFAGLGEQGELLLANKLGVLSQIGGGGELERHTGAIQRTQEGRRIISTADEDFHSTKSNLEERFNLKISGYIMLIISGNEFVYMFNGIANGHQSTHVALLGTEKNKIILLSYEHLAFFLPHLARADVYRTAEHLLLLDHNKTLYCYEIPK